MYFIMVILILAGFVSSIILQVVLSEFVSGVTSVVYVILQLKKSINEIFNAIHLCPFSVFALSHM